MDKLPPKENFRHVRDGKEIGLYFLQNDSAVSVAISNYGARIIGLLVPDREGELKDVVVGFDSIDGYLTASEEYHGAIVGRYANRISKGTFRIGVKRFDLARNNHGNHLHGGVKGFHEVIWEVERHTDDQVVLSYLSPDGEESYPGNLQIRVSYALAPTGDLTITFEGSCDQDTVINVTNHSYFNLNGIGSGDILDHLLTINADTYTPIDETSIPLGTLDPVQGTPFDFREPAQIGARIDEENQQLRNGSGYDHNYALNKPHPNELTLGARAQGDRSGIVLEVLTTEPGIQFYTGNFMQGENTIKGGVPDLHRSGFCLETQHFPDSPNQPSFPSTVLHAGATFRSETIFRLFTLPA